MITIAPTPYINGWVSPIINKIGLIDNYPCDNTVIYVLEAYEETCFSKKKVTLIGVGQMTRKTILVALILVAGCSQIDPVESNTVKEPEPIIHPKDLTFHEGVITQETWYGSGDIGLYLFTLDDCSIWSARDFRGKRLDESLSFGDHVIIQVEDNDWVIIKHNDHWFYKNPALKVTLDSGTVLMRTSSFSDF